ncbi:MAG: helicase-associated domain-containing protein [Planctomycetota bacterium]|nr:helicase-associated domain-containing protein [Planctomycetota bacterium]
MTRLSLRVLLRGSDDEALLECLRRWCGDQDDKKLYSRAGKPVLGRASAAMEDEGLVLQRVGALHRKLQDLLEVFFDADGAVRTVQSLFTDFGDNFKSRFDLEASLAALHREAFLWPVKDKRWAEYDSPAWAAPSELVECIRGYRERRQRQLPDTLTLQGFLEARHFQKHKKDKGSQQEKEQKAADHARKIYKLYTLEAAMQQRLDKLPAHVRALVDAALHTHGGVASYKELVGEVDATPTPDFELLGKSLEESMLGTTANLDLARVGVQPCEDGVVVFHEVALWALRKRSVDAPPAVDLELSAKSDLASNVSRFLRELQQSKVLFTAEGELFKASAKRIAAALLSIPGGFLSSDNVLEVIYRFCLQRRLVDRRGERALGPTPTGLQFERASLTDQLKLLLGHFVEERNLTGEAFHHTRMRRVLLRLLRRAEPLAWQDIAVLPFLTRNVYLSQLDTQAAEDFFAARFQGGAYTPSESLQQMSWNLLVWIKKRLFPLGIVDLGMHGGRVSALRLSRLGADLLEAEPATKVGGTRCSIIVQPDFEILVFPGDDEHDVLHLFDRFANRTKSDHVHQFTVDRASVLAGVEDGLTGSQIIQELTDRARAPIPQNVLYSLEDWAREA